MFESKRRMWLILALLLMTLLTVNFAVRSFSHVRRIRARSPEPVQAWMNIPHIVHAYRVPPDVIHAALELPPGKPDRRPLWQIARDQGRSPQELVAAATTAIERWRPGPPPPPAPPPAASPPSGALP